MKKLLAISILAALVAVGSVVKAQNKPPEYLGLPGDNLNLYAVMKLFQDSKTLEDFERALNDKSTGINNLDLNGDGKVDYITVTDNVNGNVHNIVLQDAVGKNEIQDVAVFTVQRFSDGGVQIQLTGDEALYGKNYIIEPNYAEQGNVTPNPGYAGDNTSVYGRDVTVVETTPYIIAGWPLIRFIFAPGYLAWHSSWYWGYYPYWWDPWTPFSWDYYYGFHYSWFNNYYGYYRMCGYHRYRDWDDIYFRHERHYSRFVNDHIRQGYYSSTYSHPEQRRQGQEAFNRMHPDINRRSAQGMQHQYAGNRYNTQSSNVRRPAINSTYSGRGSGTISNNRSNSSYRSSTATTVNRYAYNQRSSQNAVSGNRQVQSYNMRPSSGQRSSQGMVNTRPMTRQGFSGQSYRPATRQSFSAGRSSGPSRSVASFSGRSSGGHSFSSVSHGSSGGHSGGGGGGRSGGGGGHSSGGGGGHSGHGRR